MATASMRRATHRNALADIINRTHKPRPANSAHPFLSPHRRAPAQTMLLPSHAAKAAGRRIRLRVYLRQFRWQIDATELFCMHALLSQAQQDARRPERSHVRKIPLYDSEAFQGR